VGRLSSWMLGKMRAVGKWKTANSWQAACNESNVRFTGRACQAEARGGEKSSRNCRPVAVNVGWGEISVCDPAARWGETLTLSAVWYPLFAKSAKSGASPGWWSRRDQKLGRRQCGTG